MNLVSITLIIIRKLNDLHAQIISIFMDYSNNAHKILSNFTIYKNLLHTSITILK